MRSNLEIIDEYLRGELSASEKKEIENKLATDKDFAHDFALFILAKKAAKQEASAQRKAEFDLIGQQLATKPVGGPVGIFPFGRAKQLAIAASLALIIGIFWVFSNNQNPERLADAYIEKSLGSLPSMMGSQADSLQMGVELYNKKAYPEAQKIFEKLSKNNSKALEYLGLTALQQEQYDAAIQAFAQLATIEPQKSRAQLLLALSHIKKGEKEKSFEILKSINKKDLSLEDREFVEDLAVRN